MTRRREIDKYVAAVAKADDVAELVAALKQRKDQLAELEREQAALASPVPSLTPFDVRELCGDEIRPFSALLLGDLPSARQALRTLLPAPLRLRPATVDRRRTLAFEGETTLGPISQKVWRPHGDSNLGSFTEWPLWVGSGHLMRQGEVTGDGRRCRHGNSPQCPPTA